MATVLSSIFTFLFKYPPRAFDQGHLVWLPSINPMVIGASVVAIVALTVFAARRIRGIHSRDRWILGGLRVAAFVVLAACLLGPALALTSSVPERNALAIVLDDSRSMSIRDAGNAHDTVARIDAERGIFADSSVLTRQLKDRYILEFYRLSGDAAPIVGPTALSARGPRTDLATSLRSVQQTLTGTPVAGVVLVSDGADNGTGDLESTLDRLRAAHLPVYTVGVGHDALHHDLSLDQLIVPETTLRGSGATITVGLGVHDVGADSTTIVARSDGRIVDRRAVALPRGHTALSVPWRLPPLDPGLHVIRVDVEPVPGETITQNNTSEAVLQVRPGIERVLYFEGQPRSEFAFLRRAVAADSAVRLVGLLRSAKGKFLRLNVADSLDLVAGFPTRRAELFQYRALILGNIEASFFTGDQLRMISDFVDRRGGVLIALGGRQALGEGGYAGTLVGDVLPVMLSTSGTDTTVQAIKAELTAVGATHPALQLGSTTASNTARWDSLPTLTAVNRLGRLRAGATVLLTGRTTAPEGGGGAQERGGATIPLLTVERYGRGVSAILDAEDTWTWKMDPKAPLADRSYEHFWDQLIRWGLDQVPDRLELSIAPDHVSPGATVALHARLADSSYLAENRALVTAVIAKPSGAIDSVPLNWTMHDDGTYTGQLVAAEPGTYRIVAVASHAGDSIKSAEAAVLADPDGADMAHAELNAPLLQRIAHQTGGRYYPIDQLGTLSDDVAITRSGIVTHETRDLWDMPIVLIVLMLLLGADWGYRRWRGLA